MGCFSSLYPIKAAFILNVVRGIPVHRDKVPYVHKERGSVSKKTIASLVVYH